MQLRQTLARDIDVQPRKGDEQSPPIVIAGLVPAIYASAVVIQMAGTSPAMTVKREERPELNRSFLGKSEVSATVL